MEVDVKNAAIGTVIEFTVGHESGFVYDLELRSRGTWLCWHHGRVGDEEAGGATYYQADVIHKLKYGHWVARSVRRPAPASAAKYVPEVPLKSRVHALNELGVTITLRRDGWTIFESDWCRLELAPDAGLADGLKRAEATFGKN